MLGKLKWVALAAAIVSLTSGCHVCERWYEREHPNTQGRPYYYAQPPGGGCGCPPGCAPAPAACPPGCAPAAGYAPAGYSGFAPAPGGCQ
jgi:hypothetical protein